MTIVHNNLQGLELVDLSGIATCAEECLTIHSTTVAAAAHVASCDLVMIFEKQS